MKNLSPKVKCVAQIKSGVRKEGKKNRKISVQPLIVNF